MVHKHYRGDPEKGCALIGVGTFLIVGLVFWSLIIWGLFELITYLSSLNGGK